MYAIVFHAHQKLDRVAHRHLKVLADDEFFPPIRQILKFEAGHGPDSAKLKQQRGGKQPWHFLDPFDKTDTDLEEQIEQHHKRLVKELRGYDVVRASFEAAWLAHALVDGLTPAHHYPYEAELEDLRGGKGRDTRKGLAGRLYVKSDTLVESIHKSLKLVGPKGLLTSHAMFEAGAYSIIAPLRLSNAMPSSDDLELIRVQGLGGFFRHSAQEVAKLEIYSRYCESGWVKPVIRDIKDELAPRMVKAVTLAWLSAIQEAVK